MTADVSLEQVLYRRVDDGYTLAAQSAGVRPEWQAELASLCEKFAGPLAGADATAAVFARPLGRAHVAIAQVGGEAGRPALWFLVASRRIYEALLGEPFALAASCALDWQARGALPTLAWPAGAAPRRSAADVRRVLLRADGLMLLGAAQALVDGARLVFRRQAPDLGLLSALWTLLPHTTRARLWPATFAADHRLGFHVAVAPDGAAFPGYLTEAQAEEYPEGAYERRLHFAAEEGDEATIDALFGRRSREQTLRLALLLVGVALALALGMHVLNALVRP